MGVKERAMDKPKIVFLNQYAGPLFRELTEDLVTEFGIGHLYTGHVHEINQTYDARLKIIPCPDQETSSGFSRIFSWFKYVLVVLPKLFTKSPMLFIVSNPPIIPWVGFVLKWLTKQRYVILIYDLYPEMLIRFAGLKVNGIVANIWRKLNQLAFENADAVLTIGDYMARQAETMFDPARTKLGRTAVIPTWADTNLIKPLAKEENWFAKQHQQVEKMTVLYAGTLGLKHNVTAMVHAAPALRHLTDVHLLFIGRGARYEYIKEFIASNELQNVTLLPFQEEKVMPYSLTTGDVAVIAVDRGGEGVYVPGKTTYYMAAGAALLVLSASKNEVTDWVEKFQCGIVVDPDDVDGFVRAVERFNHDREFLALCKQNSRAAALKYFDRKVCSAQFIDILKEIGLE